jgi:hypothetical protein
MAKKDGKQGVGSVNMKTCIKCHVPRPDWVFERMSKEVVQGKDGRFPECGVCRDGWILAVCGLRGNKLLWLDKDGRLEEGYRLRGHQAERYSLVSWVTDGVQVWRLFCYPNLKDGWGKDIGEWLKKHAGNWELMW